MLVEVMAATVLRRGVRREDVSVERAVIDLRQQLPQVEDGLTRPCSVCSACHRGIAFGPLKTASRDPRIVDLDRATLGSLLEHRVRQDAEKALWGEGYTDHGHVFARDDGALQGRSSEKPCRSGRVVE